MDFVDFYIVLPQGPLVKSRMAPGVWREFYPKEAWNINGFVYHLISSDVVDIFVCSSMGDIKIGKTNLGRRRFFCHHNGRAMMTSDGEDSSGSQVATTFGAIYIDAGIIHKFKFFRDGTFEFDAEAYDGISPVM
jgi:hypothetical protein